MPICQWQIGIPPSKSDFLHNLIIWTELLHIGTALYCFADLRIACDGTEPLRYSHNFLSSSAAGAIPILTATLLMQILQRKCCKCLRIKLFQNKQRRKPLWITRRALPCSRKSVVAARRVLHRLQIYKQHTERSLASCEGHRNLLGDLLLLAWRGGYYFTRVKT